MLKKWFTDLSGWTCKYYNSRIVKYTVIPIQRYLNSIFEEINSYKSKNETLFHSTETVDWTKRPVKNPFSFFQAEDQVFSAYINHTSGAAFLSGGLVSNKFRE